MIVVCINNHNDGNYLTVGRKYDASLTAHPSAKLNSDKLYYLLVNDHGRKSFYDINDFKSIDLIRDEYINSILVD